jgi:branched-chain amino acid transport system substrate-binding protein
VTRRAYPLLWLAALGGLAGCVPPPASAPTMPMGTAADRHLAILLPLTGPNAGLGRDMLKAAQLALGTDGPQLDVRDTAGTPGGAAEAARAAVTAHDTIIIGPLTASETAAAAGAAQGTPVLAFTSDRQQARPGVWTLGITPEQQVERLMHALKDHGKTRLTAVLPDNAFGNALANGLSMTNGVLPLPADIHRYVTGRPASLTEALRDATGYADRRGSIEARVKAARELGDETGEEQAKAISAEPIPPPNFDSLLLAEGGPLLQTTAAALGPTYDIRPSEVQIVGPATWAREAASLRGLDGAWYAAPDPVAREDFVRAYTARYGASPPAYADLAYDAARLARNAVLDPSILLRPQGFAGVDGPFALLPDGHLRRGLAVFAIAPGGPRIVDPAPANAAGS